MKTNIVCFVQARMGSARLPGKVLLELNNHSVLYHVVTRVQQSNFIDKVVVATTIGQEDDVIIRECEKHGFEHFRGSEEDVLDRYYQAANLYAADHVVRVTSDCPLIDPKIIDLVIYRYLKSFENGINYDYASNCVERSYPRGLDVEIFSKNTLSTAWQNSNELYQREHVTPYIYQHADLFNILSIMNDEDFSSYRITLDTNEDWELINKIFKIQSNNKNISGDMRSIISIINEYPEINKINSHVQQKNK